MSCGPFLEVTNCNEYTTPGNSRKILFIAQDDVVEISVDPTNHYRVTNILRRDNGLVFVPFVEFDARDLTVELKTELIGGDKTQYSAKDTLTFNMPAMDAATKLKYDKLVLTPCIAIVQARFNDLPQTPGDQAESMLFLLGNTTIPLKIETAPSGTGKKDTDDVGFMFSMSWQYSLSSTPVINPDPAIYGQTAAGPTTGDQDAPATGVYTNPNFQFLKFAKIGTYAP